MKRYLFFLILIILFSNIASALKVISPYPIGPRGTTINVSTATTNNSLYWDGNPYSNLISQWTNDAGYYNASTIPDYYPLTNPWGFYNSSTLTTPTLHSVTDQGATTTNNVTINKVTVNIAYMFNDTYGIMKNESGDIIIGFLGGLI
jgi:hypothetical protein